MTIREHLRQRFTWGKYVVLAVGVAFVLFFQYGQPEVTPQRIRDATIGACLLVTWISYVLLAMRCPRCQANLQMTKIRQSGWHRDGRTLWERWDACPQCHASFDEPTRAAP